MMHSDLYALAACAISVLYIPFFIIAQLRFVHILQQNSFSNNRYFLWIKQNTWAVFFPLVGICSIVLLGRAVLGAYLSNTALYDTPYFIGFFGMLLVIAAAVTLVFVKYNMTIKIENRAAPFIYSDILMSRYVLSSVLVAGLTLAINLIHHAKVLVFFTPILVPLLAPAANKILQAAAPSARAEKYREKTS